MAGANISHPHDKLFKDTFSRKNAAIAYLQAYLPEKIKTLIDFNSLQVYPGEYIDEALKGSSSDLVYQVSLAGQPAYLYFLFEHQSSPQSMMAFRLLKYLVRLWDALLKEQPDTKTLPPVIPMLLYQNKAMWSASLEFIDLIKPVDDNLKPYIPNFQYALVDLSSEQDSAMLADVHGQLTLLLMKAVAEGTIFNTLQRQGDLINQLLKQNNALDVLETLFRYALNADDSIGIHDLQQLVQHVVEKTEGEKTMATIADRLIQQGLERGIEQGLEEGRKEGRKQGREQGEMQLILEQIQLMFPDSGSVSLEGYSSSQLEAIAERLMLFASLEEVLGLE